MDELDQILGPTQQAPAASGLVGGATQGAGTQAPMPQEQTPKGLDDLDRILNDGQAKDPLLDELLPLSMSGNTPETAMNKSPLSASDRLKLSLGNVEGNVKYLRQRFADAKPIADSEGKPTSDLAVFDGQSWYRVDPVNGDIADPWEKTKEYLKDASEFAPEALGVAAGAGSSYLSGGLTLPQSAAIGGAVSGAVRTSLGRIVGTYEASPAEQAWDIGFEALLNAAGTKILAGTKPTAKWVSNKMDDLYAAFKDTIPDNALSRAGKQVGDVLADAPKNLYKKIFASYSVGEQNFDTFLEHPERTKAMMKSAYAQTGTNTDAYHNTITERQVGSIKEAVLDTPKMLTTIYGSMRNEILAQTPESFTANLDDVLRESYQDAVDKGIGKLIIKLPDAVKRSMRDVHTGIQIPDEVIPGGSKSLTGSAAVEYLQKNGLKNARFELISKKEFIDKLPVAKDIGNEASYLAHSEAHAELKTYYDKLGLFAGGRSRTGRDAAKSLLDFKKVATDIAWELENKDNVKALTGIRDIIAKSRLSIDSSIHNGLKGAGDDAAEIFAKMNQTYNELNQEMKPVLNIVRQYRANQNDKVFEGLLSKFTSRGGRNISEKGAFEGARGIAEQYGIKETSNKIATAQMDVRVGEAAKAFNPIKPGTYKADAIGTSQMGIAMYALASQNPALLAAIVGMQTLRSPTTARAAAATSQGLYKGQQMVSNMTKKELNAFLSDPAAMQTFMTGVTSAPITRMKADQQIDSVLQQLQGPPQ